MKGMNFSKRGNWLQALAMAALMAAASGVVNAAPVFTNSAVVTSPANEATFDGITGSLLNYTEDGIIVSVNDTHCCFANTHYGNGGNEEWVTISLQNGGTIHALDFLLGDGWGGAFDNNPTNLIWETFVGVVSTGFGDVNLIKGTTVGWTDDAGFTSLRVAANPYGINSFGSYQAIALDNLRIGSATAPEPAAFILLSLGLAGFGWRRRRQA